MAEPLKKRALLIAGPTASGKSALALDLARQWNGVVINADAVQVYAELRILSARPLPEEEEAVPHRLYGHVPGKRAYSVARWLAEAELEMNAVWERGLVPVITGGTGLYFRALEKGLAPVPEIPEEVRERWRSFPGDLHAELWQRDPAMAARLLTTDRQRLTRALEVIDATGARFSTGSARGRNRRRSKVWRLSASSWTCRATSFMRGPSTASTRC